MIDEMFSNSTPKILKVLYDFYPEGLTVSQISRISCQTRPTIYEGIHTAMKYGLVKRVDPAKGLKLYSLYSDKVNDELDKLINHSLDFREKNKLKKIKSQKRR